MTDDVDETVEHTDVGVILTAELKRGTGKRDEEKVVARVKARTLEEAVADMETAKDHMEAWARDLRAIQPTEGVDE